MSDFNVQSHNDQFCLNPHDQFRKSKLDSKVDSTHFFLVRGVSGPAEGEHESSKYSDIYIYSS